jgi:putative phosphoesterase
MLIGIIADTHDNAKNFLKAIDIFNKKNVEVILHLGDWVSPFMLRFCKQSQAKIISIFGNNEHDRKRYAQKAKQFEVPVKFIGTLAELILDNTRFFLCHGKSKEELQIALSSKKYDVVLSADTHLALQEKIGKTLHINPGTTCGIHNEETNHELTIALYNTHTHQAEIVHLD